MFWQGEDARDRKRRRRRRRNARRLLLVQRNQQEMGWVGDSHMGTSDIRKQLHICKLLSSAQDSDAVQPEAVEQLGSGQGRGQKLRLACRLPRRLLAHMGHLAHRRNRRLPRLRCPVPRCQPKNLSLTILAGALLGLFLVVGRSLPGVSFAKFLSREAFFFLVSHCFVFLLQMALALCFGGNSTTWMNTAVLVTCMRNFPRSRGNVTGILKGYVGLSTAIFTELCTSLFTSEASAFLLLLTFLPAIVCLVAIAFLSEVPPSSTKEEDTLEYSNFTILNSISMALAFYLLTFTLIGKFFVISSFANKLFAGVLLLFLVAPLVVPIQLLYSKYMRNRSSAAQQSQGDKMRIPLLLEDNQQKDELQGGGEPTATTHQPIFENLENGEEESMRAAHPEQCVTMDDVPSIVTPPHPPLDDQMFLANQVLERDSEVGKKRKRHAPATTAPGGEEDHHHTLVDGGLEGSGKKWHVPPALGEDHTLLDALQTIDFWLLFFTFLCGVGTGITAINNLGQIGQAQGYSDVSLFISFISIWGFFGRIGAGAISEYYVRSVCLE